MAPFFRGPPTGWADGFGREEDALHQARAPGDSPQVTWFPGPLALVDGQSARFGGSLRRHQGSAADNRRDGGRL